MHSSRMRESHARLLDSVRAGLGLEPTGDVQPIDAATARLAVSQKVHALVAAAVERVGADPRAHTMLRLMKIQSEAASARQLEETRRVHEAFEAAGIPHALFKGPALAVQTGRRPRDRVGGDIDILIRPSDWRRAHSALEDTGFAILKSPPPGRDARTRFLLWSWWEAHYRKDDVEVDLHWSPQPGKHPMLEADMVLDRATPIEIEGMQILTFDADLALAHTALTGARIHWANLRPVVDAHLLVEVAGARWDLAQALIPYSPALDQCRDAVAMVRGGSPREPLGDHAPDTSWARGPTAGPSERTGLRDDLRQVSALGSGRRAKAAIALHWAIPPESMIGLPRPLWFLGILRAPSRLSQRYSGER